MEPLPYWFASFGNISSSALICPIYFDGSIRLWILYYVYSLMENLLKEHYSFFCRSLVHFSWIIYHHGPKPISIICHLPNPLCFYLVTTFKSNNYFLLTMTFSNFNHIIVDYLWTRSGTSFNPFLFIKNIRLFISSEGFSEGNAADPVGRDSPLKLVMAVWGTFFKF